MGCCSSRAGWQELSSYERSDPLLDIDCKAFEYGGVKVVRCAVQGWRKKMEDVALVQYGVSPRENTLALGVFDGHSGSEAAEFAREKLLGHIKATDEWQKGDVSGGCTKGFLSADVAMRKSGISSGTTAVLALVGPDDIVVANCGDSRSVLSRGGRQLPMSIDHKPGRKDERRRILKSGGYLDESDPRHPRVVRDHHNMSIATSRALGDFDFKNDPSRPAEGQMVSPVPEFYIRQRTPEDEFLILASDGVWDVMDNPSIVAFLSGDAERLGYLKDNGEPAPEPESSSLGDRGSADGTPGQGGEGGGATRVEALARAVLRRCIDLGSRDNTTVVIADLRRRSDSSPHPPEPGGEGEGGDRFHPSPVAVGGSGAGGDGGGGPRSIPAGCNGCPPRGGGGDGVGGKGHGHPVPGSGKKKEEHNEDATKGSWCPADSGGLRAGCNGEASVTSGTQLPYSTSCGSRDEGQEGCLADEGTAETLMPSEALGCQFGSGNDKPGTWKDNIVSVEGPVGGSRDADGVKAGHVGGVVGGDGAADGASAKQEKLRPPEVAGDETGQALAAL